MARVHTVLVLERLVCDKANDLTTALRRTPGVTRVYVDTATEAAFVEHHTDQITRADLVRIMERVGLSVRSVFSAHA